MDWGRQEQRGHRRRPTRHEPVGEPGMPALHACAFYAKRLARDGDVFMYRGDTPLCSKECRHEQMQLDAVSAKQAA